MLFHYTYQDHTYALSVEWNDPDGKSVIHTSIVEQLAALHGELFMAYWDWARQLDEKTDELYQCIAQFNDEDKRYAVPYNPKHRDRFLSTFSAYCSCLETGIVKPSPQIQTLRSLFEVIESILQETVGIYLMEQSYQNKHFKRSRRLEERSKPVDDLDAVYEFETTLLQMLDLSRSLERLTEVQRRRLVNHLFLGLTFQEIAEQEGVSKQSVEESVAAGLRKLRTLL